MISSYAAFLPVRYPPYRAAKAPSQCRGVRRDPYRPPARYSRPFSVNHLASSPRSCNELIVDDVHVATMSRIYSSSLSASNLQIHYRKVSSSAYFLTYRDGHGQAEYRLPLSLRQATSALRLRRWINPCASLALLIQEVCCRSFMAEYRADACSYASQPPA